MASPWDALASPANGDRAVAGNAPSRYGRIAHAGNADLAYAGTARPDFMKPPPSGGPGPMPPPVATFTYSPSPPHQNDNTTFDASASTPGYPAAPISGYAWAFKSGTVTRTGVTCTWRLPSGPGSYDAVLTVTASDGQKGTQTQVLVI